MTEFFAAVAGYGAFWALATTLVWQSFKRMSEASSDSGRFHATRQLKSERWRERAAAWPKAFNDAFDGIFGEKHFTLRCLGRSLLASACVVVVFTSIWAVIHPDQMVSWVGIAPRALSSLLLFADTLMVVAVVLIVNGIGDYCSLLETRLVLRVLARNPGLLKTVCLIAADAIVTWVIFAIALTAGWLLVTSVTLSIFLTVNPQAYIAGWDGLTFSDLFIGCLTSWNWRLNGSYDDVFGGWVPPHIILKYSTFFTSIWVWFFALSRLAILVITALSWLFRAALARMDVDEKPYLAMGGAWCRILHACFAIGFPFYLWIVWPD